MGGILRSSSGKPAGAVAAETMASQRVAVDQAQEAKPATQAAAEDKAARRRARRGGRSLLSDSRLNPEQGVATLGTTGL
jgi:microcystin degradation protein MlrC